MVEIMPFPSSLSAFPDKIHISVLLKEVVDFLRPQAGGRYLDGTLGLGGHAFAILSQATAKNQEGKNAEEKASDITNTASHSTPDDSTFAELCGLDRDAQALELAKIRLAPFENYVHLFHRRYSQFTTVLDEIGWSTVNGALLDLGLSSLQIDDTARGFSFLTDGPLDMRMDRTTEEAPVSKLVNQASFEQLKNIITQYGEDPQAGRIAQAIVDARSRKPIETTLELADIVEYAYPPAWRRKARNHPATRTFQALRMVVNNELGELELFLDSILDRLAPCGRLAVISFHSLEDRMVKQKMRAWTQNKLCQRVTHKPLVPSAEEQAENPRARSAKLRVAEKI